MSFRGPCTECWRLGERQRAVALAPYDPLPNWGCIKLTMVSITHEYNS